MKKTEITCDACGADLYDSGPQPMYRLTLASESVGSSSSFRYGTVAHADVKRPHHFCDLKCLDHWRSREKQHAAVIALRLDAWKQERGSKKSFGFSYPSPPEDTLAAWQAEAHASALAEFPVAKPPRR